jgi:hypothetical protein
VLDVRQELVPRHHHQRAEASFAMRGDRLAGEVATGGGAVREERVDAPNSRWRILDDGVQGFGHLAHEIERGPVEVAAAFGDLAQPHGRKMRARLGLLHDGVHEGGDLFAGRGVGGGDGAGAGGDSLGGVRTISP